MERKELLLRKNKRNMKEQKISIGMKDVDNPSLAVGRGSLLNCPRPSFLDFKFEIPFQLPSAVYLLCLLMSCFVSCYFITNGTVSNKIANIWSICGPVFKTFISIITKYELITIFEA